MGAIERDGAAPHMTPDEFRAAGHAAVDWIADYWANIEEFGVNPPRKPGAVSDAMPVTPPAGGEPIQRLLEDLDTIVLPGMTHWQHPSYFGYFPANVSGPAVLGDLLSSGLGVQGMLWSTGPAATEVETRVMDWLVELLGLPAAFRSDSDGGGVIQDSASSATLVATLAALHRASGGSVRTDGVQAEYVIYSSNQAHSSLEKAALIAGIGTSSVRSIDVDDSLAMRTDLLTEAIQADLAAGRRPAMVMATIGTTSTTAIDPVADIAEICHQHDIWLHVDAAYAGAAALCPELRWTHDGVELADSYCMDPHKWMLTNFDCDAFFTRDRSTLISALSVLPEYLRNAATESGAVLDYRDWQVPLGRRFRALKLWSVLRWYGADGLRAHVRSGVRQADRFADLVAADDRFEVVTDHPFGLVCFRLVGEGEAADVRNQELLSALNADGEIFLTHTKIRGTYVLRLAIGGTFTQDHHIESAWRTIQRTATNLSERE